MSPLFDIMAHVIGYLVAAMAVTAVLEKWLIK